MPAPLPLSPVKAPASINLADLAGIDGITLPRHKRAEATMHLIVDVVRSLLRQKPLDAITIDEITALAGCSPPSIYARFRDKTTLLSALYRVHTGSLRQTLAAFLEPGRWRRRELGDFAASLARLLARVFEEDRNLYRAVLASPDPALRARVAADMEELARAVRAAVEAIDGSAGQVDREQVRPALLALVAGLHGATVWGWLAEGEAGVDQATLFARAIRRGG